MSAINSSSSAALFMPVTEQAVTAKLQQQGSDQNKLKTAQIKTDSATPSIDRAELERALEVVNQAVALEQRSLSFSIDDKSGKSVIRVVDFATDELIKQIPSEELLKVAQDIKRLQEEMGQSIGLLIDNKV